VYAVFGVDFSPFNYWEFPLTEEMNLSLLSISWPSLSFFVLLSGRQCYDRPCLPCGCHSVIVMVSRRRRHCIGSPDFRQFVEGTFVRFLGPYCI